MEDASANSLQSLLENGNIDDEEVSTQGDSNEFVDDSFSLNKSSEIGRQFQNMKERLNLSLDNHPPRRRSFDLNTSVSSDLSIEYSTIDEDIEKSPRNGFEEFYKHYRNKVIRNELILVSQHRQDGIYVVPSVKSLQIWFGVLFIRDGPYKEGIFHFTIYFSDDYPESVPVLRFKSKIFHPQIEIRRGVLNTEPVFFKSPNKKEFHVWELLEYARSCFYHLRISESKNNEAANLFRTDFSLFKARCRSSVLDSLLEFEEQRHVGDYDYENPFRSRLIEHDIKDGVKNIILTKSYRLDKSDGMVEWAKNQLGKVLNNIAYYSPVGKSRDVGTDLPYSQKNIEVTRQNKTSPKKRKKLLHIKRVNILRQNWSFFE